LEDAISIAANRPQVESYIEGGMATAIEVPGGMTHSTIINDLTPARSVKSTTEWLKLGDVLSPTHDKFYIPNQTGLRPYQLTTDIPINRDGHIWRGTAGYRNGSVSAGADQITKLSGAQFFRLQNPTLNVDATRYPDYFVLFLADGRGQVDPRMDDKDQKKGYLFRHKPYNRFWKFYGKLKNIGTSQYEFTIPYILVGSRTLGTVTSAVPRPWQGYGNAINNATLEWDLIDVIIGTKATGGGVTAVFDYQNQVFNWFNTGAENSALERHQFIWIQ